MSEKTKEELTAYGLARGKCLRLGDIKRLENMIYEAQERSKKTGKTSQKIWRKAMKQRKKTINIIYKEKK